MNFSYCSFFPSSRHPTIVIRTGCAIALSIPAALSRLSGLSSLNSMLLKFHSANIYKYVDMIEGKKVVAGGLGKITDELNRSINQKINLELSFLLYLTEINIYVCSHRNKETC